MSQKVQCPECHFVFFADPPKSMNFRAPTIEEVETYCKQRGNKVDPRRFVDFYESKGWMIGKNKMKSFEAAIRTWERDGKTVETAGGDTCPLCNVYRMQPKAKVCSSCGAHCRRCGESTPNLTIVKRQDKSLTAVCQRCLGELRGK